MNREAIAAAIKEFCSQTHGSTDYGDDVFYVMGDGPTEYAPLKFITKKFPELDSPERLVALGLSFAPHEVVEDNVFRDWYQHQFGKKLLVKQTKSFAILYEPRFTNIFNILEDLNKIYETLRGQHILLNGKNLPVQVGEWLAKCIFGMRQVRSSSQRGFDFYMGEKRIEVKVHWKEFSSPKGVKIKKSLIELSDACILIYLSKNLLIRDICYLDSNFIMRKFAGKGHTIFLKDPDLASYFFSRSDKHLDKVGNKTLLMKFSSPQFAMKLDGRF